MKVRMKIVHAGVLVSLISPANAFIAPRSFLSGSKMHRVASERVFDPCGFSSPTCSSVAKSKLGTQSSSNQVVSVALATTAATLSTAAPANAFSGTGSDAVPSAFAAYGHYLGLVLIASSLTAERLLVKPGMSDEDEEKLAVADIVYGLAGVLVLVTGYFRVTEYGKGWEFYSHSPVFWVKTLLFTIMGASSFFPTVTIIQRAVGKKAAGKEGKSGDNTAAAAAVGVPPMSEKLAGRMVKIINGELLAVASIPLAASLMSRGVGYADWLPWPVGAAPTALALGGLGFKYVKEALDWKEDGNDGDGTTLQ